MSDEISMCRICLKTGKMIDLFKKIQTTTIAEKLVKLAKLQISPDDVPRTICLKCSQTLDISLDFIQLIKDSDWKARSELRNKLKPSEETIDVTTSHPNMTVKGIIDNNQNQSPDIEEVISSFLVIKKPTTHSGEQPFTCQYCDKGFKCQWNLKLHLKMHTRQTASPNLGPHSGRVGLRPVPPLVRLDQCPTKRRIDSDQEGAATQQKSALITHVRNHTEEKSYCCQHCPQKFATFGNLQKHIKQHLDEKSYECGTCGSAFSSRSLLAKHKFTHVVVPPFLCMFCGMVLTCAPNLNRHMSTKHYSSISWILDPDTK